MLVSQPPVHTMTIKQSDQSVSGVFERRTVLEDLSGRMDALYDLTVLLVDRPLKHFSFRWRGSDPKPETDLMLEIHTWNGWMYAENERVPSDGEKSIKITFGEWRPKELSVYDLALRTVIPIFRPPPGAPLRPIAETSSS
ncbi:hypothetical protein MSAN_01872100 [Mycena sanguinolenta]|uniref:Uncharacterized protein n=1 Tax=Mycena sanguinolenta TaxID=230812 RepID=A0A8H6XTS3_9AGAR|nr:hypothetical protein MSAN_01872100 [Mycena sanguinolenta]